jgi:hypothetical protein
MATTASVSGEDAGLNRVAKFLRELPAVSMYSDSTVEWRFSSASAIQ